MLCRVAVLLAALVATSAPGRYVFAAGDATAATRHFEEGRKLYQVGEYRAALEKFKQAYLAKEDPVFLYNIAQCHRHLGDRDQAVTFYRRYLAAAPNVANRAEVEKMISDLEARPQTTVAPAAPAPASPPAAAPAPAPGPTAPQVSVAVAPPPAGRTGLHLELALGGGGMRDDFTWLGLARGNATGGSAAAHLAAGLWVLPRLVVGGALALEWVQSPRIEVQGRRSDTVSVGALSFLGLFGAYRVSPDGGAGLHLQAALGGSRMTLQDTSGGVSNHSPVGGGLFVGAGYDWALRSDWQAGILGRLMIVTMSDEGVSHRVETLSILAFLAYQ